jgi:hypothetical protein
MGNMLHNIVSNSVPESKMVPGKEQGFLAKALNDSANAWNWGRHKILILWAVPFIISVSVIIAGLINRDVYQWIVKEDGIIENATVLFYALAFIGSLQISRSFFKNGDKLLAFLFAGLSLAMLFMCGEEIGWGQQIFFWQTPAALKAINKQSETTFHNIYGVEGAFRWLQMLVGAYGTLLPLAALFIHLKGRLGQIIQRVIPHYSLIPYFVFIFVWKIFREVYPNPKYFEWAIAEYNEVMEIILAIGFSLFVLYQLRSLRSQAK